MQRVIRATQFFFVHEPCERIEPGAAHLFGHIGGIEPGFHCLALELLDQLYRQVAGAFDLGFMRVQLVLDKSAGGFDDHPLFVGQGEIHAR